MDGWMDGWMIRELCGSESISDQTNAEAVASNLGRFTIKTQTTRKATGNYQMKPKP